MEKPKEKYIPSNPDAERSVLGSILLNRDAIAAIADSLKPEDFYLEQHGWIYEAALACYRKRTPPDFQTISNELRRKSRLDEVGGVPFLLGLTEAVPSSYHIQHYAQAVRETSVRRRLLQAGSRIAQLAYNESQDIDASLADAQAALSEIMAASTAQIGELVPLMSVMDEIYAYLTTEEEDVPFIPTGLRDYDEAIGGGLWPGELVIPAGRPGHGKSSFVGTIAVNVASLQAQNVAVFSLEMHRLSLGIRYLSMQSGVNGSNIRKRRLTDAQREDVLKTMASMDYTLYLSDARLNVSQIRQRCLQFVNQRGPLGLVVVDYLQLIKTEGRPATRDIAVTEIVESLRDVAKELKCTVMSPAQMNREINKRADPRPTMADLRESGGIENTADRVEFIVRPELFDPETDKKGVGLLYIDKQRNEQTAIVPLKWDGARTCYEDLSGYREMEGY